MKQSFAKPPVGVEGAAVMPTLPLLLAIAVEAAQGCGGIGLPRAGWVMRVVVESIEDTVGAEMPTGFFSGARKPGRGVVDAAVQPMLDSLVDTGFLVPVGTGTSAVWHVDSDRCRELQALRQSVAPFIVAAARVAGQRAAAMAVALSKTSRASRQSTLATSTS